MQREETLREVAALRHNLHINSRLRLEFLASISKLLRDYGISADDQLLGSLILAVPDELSAGEAPFPPEGEPFPPTPPDDEPFPPTPPDDEPFPPTPPDDEPFPPEPPIRPGATQE